MEQKYKDALTEVIGCFDAAIIEGLYNALQNTEDYKLKDLIERRVLFAYHAAIEAMQE